MSRYCSQCGKSIKACICKWIQTLTPSVELIILQHSSETNRPLGTARILSLSLTNSYCFVGEDFTNHTELNQLIRDSDYQHFVLYPGETSVAYQAVQNTLTKNNKVRVILLDGTWKKAYKIWQLSSNINGLPQVHLPSDLEGNYRIRKAPNKNSLSTVEAGYHILSLVEPEMDFSPLLNAFEQMIDFQIRQIPQEVFARNYR